MLFSSSCDRTSLSILFEVAIFAIFSVQTGVTEDDAEDKGVFDVVVSSLDELLCEQLSCSCVSSCKIISSSSGPVGASSDLASRSSDSDDGGLGGHEGSGGFYKCIQASVNND